MRLIDADEVLETLERVFKEYSLSWLPDNENGGSAYAIPNAIKNIPTAYDVDKVVEQMKEEYACWNCRRRDECNECAGGETIDIIKRGGIDE